MLLPELIDASGAGPILALKRGIGDAEDTQRLADTLYLGRRQGVQVGTSIETPANRIADQDIGTVPFVQSLNPRRDVHRLTYQRIGQSPVAADIGGHHIARMYPDAMPQWRKSLLGQSEIDPG